MRLRIGILIFAMTASAAWAQMPILNNTRAKLKVTDKNLPQNAMNMNAPATHSATPAKSSKGGVSASAKPAVKPVKAAKTYKKAILVTSAPQQSKPEVKSEPAKGEAAPAPTA